MKEQQRDWTPVSVIVTTPDGKEHHYKSQSAAARAIGASVGNVHDCVRGARRSILNHKIRRA